MSRKPSNPNLFTIFHDPIRPPKPILVTPSPNPILFNYLRDLAGRCSSYCLTVSQVWHMVRVLNGELNEIRLSGVQRIGAWGVIRYPHPPARTSKKLHNTTQVGVRLGRHGWVVVTGWAGQRYLGGTSGEPELVLTPNQDQIARRKLALRYRVAEIGPRG